MNNINLSSQAWCDLVFEGKNKDYGAYAIRLDSSNRHLKALFIVTALGLTALLAGNVISKNKDTSTSIIDKNYGEVTITEYREKDPDKVEIPQMTIPEPPKSIASSIAFSPPVIAPDDIVDPESLMPTQDQLNNTNAVIATVTHQGTTDGPEGVLITDVEPQIVAPPVEKIYTHVEQMPSYPGGEAALMSFLKNNLVYPTMAQEIGIEGTVIVRFVVNTDGSVGEVEILRSLDSGCDREAMRVIKKMSKWVPGKQNGVEVKVYHTLPIRFRLSR